MNNIVSAASNYLGSLNETIVNIKDYAPTFEKSQWGGFRAWVVHRSNKTTMYLSQDAFKTADRATELANVYLNAYARSGDLAATKAARDFVRNFSNDLYK